MQELLKDKNTVEVYPQLQQALFNQKTWRRKSKGNKRNS